MKLSRQALGSVAQLLASLPTDSVDILFFKHLDTPMDNVPYGQVGILDAVQDGTESQLAALVGELVREKSAIRADAGTKYVFDGRWRELERWLLFDGWAVEEGQLARVSPDAEEETEIREKMWEDLEASGLDEDGAIRQSVENAGAALATETPDYNASITNVRIALETVARRAATQRATDSGTDYEDASWGRALDFLRNVGVLDQGEEEILARVYTFISPGAHVPAGVTDEEWARLARTFGLSSAYFILKKNRGAS